jgi:transcriptional regulator with XRE-family HTH domain
MARRQWNMTRLASEVGVSDMWVSRRLRGETDFTVSDLDQIALALGVPVEALIAERAA